MKHNYKKYILIGIVLFILSVTIFFMIKQPFNINEFSTKNKTTINLNNLNVNELQESPKVLMAVNSDSVIVNDILYTSINNKTISKPFVENGISYYPLNVVAELYNAEIEQLPYNLFVITNRFKEKTLICANYSIGVYNNAEIKLDGTPLIKDDTLYLPVRNLMKFIGVHSTYDYTKGILKLNSNEISDSDYSLIKNNFNILEYSNFDIGILNSVSQQLHIDIETIMEHARGGYLYSSNEQGKLNQILLKDDFTINNISLNEMLVYTPNEYFIEGFNGDYENLYTVVDNKLTKIDVAPKIKEKNSVLSSKIQFHNTKYLKDVYNLSLQSQLEQELKNIDNSIFKGDYIYQFGDTNNDLINIKKILMNETNKKIPLTNKYDFYIFDAVANFQQSHNINITGMIDDVTLNYIQENGSSIDEINVDSENITQTKWKDLIENCKIGDVLLFRKSIGTEYGLNNHAALIVDILPGGKLQLLHARGIQYGVGFEDEMDYLSLSMLEKDEYWKKTDMITVYELPDLNDEDRIKLVKGACKKYQKYDFGYMNILGKKEISCGELLRDAYQDVGYEIYDKQLFPFDISNLKDGMNLDDIIFLPDTIMLSDIMKIKSVWQRS